MLDLAGSLAKRGHQADLVIPRLVGDYRASIPREMRMFRSRDPRTDGRLLRDVQRSGVEVKVLTFSPVRKFRAWRNLRRSFPEVPVVHGRGLRSVYFHAETLARYIRESNPDVVLSALQGANSVAVCAAELTGRTVPTVITVHTNVARGYSPHWLIAAQTLYPLADAVVGVSRGVAESVSRILGLDSERVHHIYNGVLVDRIRQLAEEEIAHPWFMEGEPPVVLSVGRESAAKDFPTLVQAFGLARREVNARLIILGGLSSRFREQLRSIAFELGVEQDIEFLDFDENPYRYMMKAGLLAHSSHWEGLSTVILEALACGTPVVSTDTPHGSREILGCWSELPPVGDVVALGRAMVAALQGERPTEQALRARADAFSLEKTVDAYVGLFEKLVSDRTP